MTDTSTTSKPMWTRCPSCKDRVFNDKLDIGIHRGHCPADLQRALQDLERRFSDLKTAFGRLDDEVSSGPAIDPDDIAPWDGDDQTGNDDVADDFPDEDDEDEDEDEEIDERPPLTAYTGLTPADTYPRSIQ